MINRKLIDRYLHSIGVVTVRFCEDGLAMLDMFKVQHSTIDVILMDISMPVMDGLTAARKIREVERERKLARTPIWAVTANALSEDREKYMANEVMDDVITKPIRGDRVRELLEAVAAERAAKSSSPRSTSTISSGKSEQVASETTPGPIPGLLKVK